MLTHTRDDLHQDHRLACELTWNTFRDHLVLEYEIPKCRRRPRAPNLFVPAEQGAGRGEARPARPVVRQPARQALVRRRGLPRADADPRHGVPLVERVRRGVLRPKVVSSVSGSREGSRHRSSRVHRLGARAAGRGRGPRRHRARLRASTGAATSGRPSTGTRRSTATSATSRPPTSPASTRSSTSRRSRTTRSATSTPTGPTTSTSTARSSSPVAAKEAGVGRFVFASSCSMYGAPPGDELLDEDAPLRPLTAYAESKVRAEEALFELADDDFAPVSMRNATAYGASPRLRLDIVLNNLVGWAHTTGRDQPPERRHGVAAARPHPGHRGCCDRAARRAGGRRPRRGVQHRLRGAELSDPRPRRGRARRHARVRGDVRRGRRHAIRGATASTSGSSSARSPGSRSSGRRAWCRRARRGVPRRRADTRGVRRGPLRALAPAQAPARRRRARRRAALGPFGQPRGRQPAGEPR